MTTAREVIVDALEKIGVYAPGETVQDADANRALVVLNDMLSAWQEEYLAVYSLSQVVIPTVANVGAYTIGPGATIAKPRPPRIASGPGAASASQNVITLSTTQAAPLNYPILSFAGSGPAVGQSIVDLTNPSAIPMGATVQSISGNNVTMSVGAVGAGVQSGDSIVFGTPPQNVAVVSAVEWGNIISVNLSLGVPDVLYYDPRYPRGMLFLSPIPSAAGTVMLDAWQALLQFVNLDVPNIRFAVGGESAVKSGLAVVLRNYFNDAVVPVTVAAEAALAKANLQYTNITSRAMLRRGMQRPA